MSLANLLQKVTGTQQRFVRDFRDLVRQVADGQVKDAELIARTLQDASKTTDDLQQAVELLQRRRAFRQTVTAAAALEHEPASLRQQIAAADRALAEAERQHTQVTMPLYFRLEEIAQANRDADEAKRQLWYTCTDPELLSALADVTAERQALANRQCELTRRRDELHELANADQEQLPLARSEADTQSLRQRSQHFRARSKECEVELARLAKRVAQLEQSERDLRNKMLEP